MKKSLTKSHIIYIIIVIKHKGDIIMKKFVCTFAIIFAFVFGVSALSACTVTKSTGEEYFTFEYLEETDSYQISASSLEFSGAIFIPKEYQGKPVTNVKANGFSASNCNGITDVVFRATDSITVGAEAFKGIKNLKTVDFYAKNVTIEEKAFEERQKEREDRD